MKFIILRLLLISSFLITQMPIISAGAFLPEQTVVFETTIFWWSTTDSPVTPFAASELRSYLYKMTGVYLKVAPHDEPGCNPDGVLIVYRDYSFPKLNCPILEIQDSWNIQVNDGFTFLTGNNPRGTLYAVYAFLEKHGVRFYAPNFSFYQGMAEQVPQRSSIRLLPFEEMQSPSFMYRRKYVEEGWSHTLTTTIALIDWMAKNRLNTLVFPTNYQGMGMTTWDTWRADLIPELKKRGIILEVGGHGYQNFLPPSTYKPVHPEWFGGNQEPVVGVNTNPPANVFRITNDDAMDAFLNNVVEYLLTHPEIQIFDIWPPDGTKWIRSDIDQLGSVPNAQAYVTRKLEERLSMEGINIKLETIAYWLSITPPDADYMYGPNTLIDIAPYDRSYRELISDPNNEKNAYYNQIMTTWGTSAFQGDLSIYEYYRKYSWHSWPNVFLNLIQAEIPYYNSKNINGFGIYSEPDDWITYEPVHYLTAALSWNAQLDSNRFIDSYLWLRYGDAWFMMKAYFSVVEDAGRQMFTGPAGEFGNLVTVRQVRDTLFSAQQELILARQFADQPQAKFIIDALFISQIYTMNDIDISYYLLMENQPRAVEAREKAHSYIDTYRFNGIILQNYFSIYRYDPTITRLSVNWVYKDYRTAFDPDPRVRKQLVYLPIVTTIKGDVDLNEYLEPFDDQVPDP